MSAPVARVVRLRSLVLRDARVTAGRRVSELAVAEDVLARLDQIGRSYLPSGTSTGTALAALAAAQDRLARARAASENRRALAARQLADAAHATAVAQAGLQSAQSVLARVRQDGAHRVERRRLEDSASVARPSPGMARPLPSLAQALRSAGGDNT